MPIQNADLTAGTGFVLEPMNLTDTQKVLVTNIIANIQGNEAGIDALAEDSQAKLNEVITAVNDLKDGTDTDIATLESNINAIMYLESEAGNDSFVGLFSKLYESINNKKEALAFTLDVAESPNGEVLLDLSAYNFQSTEEYEVLPSIVTDATGRSLGVDFKKVNVNGGILTIRDKDRLQFGDNPEARYDAFVKGKVQITVVIVRTAVALQGDLTEVDGDKVHLGHTAQEHILLMSDVTITASEGSASDKLAVTVSSNSDFDGRVINVIVDGLHTEEVDGTMITEPIQAYVDAIVLDANGYGNLEVTVPYPASEYSMGITANSPYIDGNIPAQG
jgi:hypothetical protein